MSDIMRLIPFDQLMTWALSEYNKQKEIFGISEDKFFKKNNDKKLSIFGGDIETPIGPAAGPNTQLAQNIITSYLTGSRFFELKTVQILDGEDLPVSKPCILATDECYNVEWSTELRVPQAMDEYIKAWFALKVLSKEFGLGSDTGFVFNMSVGYDLEGIKTEKINNFIEGLKDASKTTIWRECKEYLLNNISQFKNVDRSFVEGISHEVCASVTLSTLHGCPPAEIDRIARYLLTEKKVHTFIKCNPTMLGYEFARDILNKMGYEYISFDDHHFKHDLQYSDAIDMFKGLKELAKSLNKQFGVKITNTFPVKIRNSELPGEEMYMSGRSLYPLSINLAYKLANEFNGDLRISYSGGADYFNIDRIYQTGIWPITLATTILKPGGYARITQMSTKLDELMETGEFTGINVPKLKALIDSVTSDMNHRKERREVKSRKISGHVPLVDCYIAPCKNGCPIEQDVPEYIRLAGEGRFKEALEVIIAKNPMPFTTGNLCNHNCMTKCTRIDYDESVKIRSMKLLSARKGYDQVFSKITTPEVKSNTKVAIIGAGPAGLAAGYFLGKNGIQATIFDCKEKAGGIIENVAPFFRITKEEIQCDIDLVKKMGVEFKLGVDANFSVDQLKKEGYEYIYIAIGAWKSGVLKLESCDKEILNVISFLEEYNKAPNSLNVGKNVAIIGAGNSAMDAARSAKRIPGVENVYVVYRRTKKEMPADKEELELAIKDGVIFKELLSPTTLINGVLKCQKMELGAPDMSGRRSTVAVDGQYDEIKIDTIIAAVGEKVDTEILTKNGISVDEKGRVKVDPETSETNVQKVFIGGDALRGPSLIVQAIADGTKVAKTILKRELGVNLDLSPVAKMDSQKQQIELMATRGVLQNYSETENEHNRCLECNQYCGICKQVCPNRANVAVEVKTDNLLKSSQIIHVDGMCNECGNCEAFCPYESAPYKDKLTLYWSKEDFIDSKNAGFVLTNEAERTFDVRLGDKVSKVKFDPSGKFEGEIPKELADVIWTAYSENGFLFVKQ